MEINLTVTASSCPLQVEGTYGDIGVHYRVYSGRYQLWLNPDGAADCEWLSSDNRIDRPDVERSFYDPRYASSIPYALYTIGAVIRYKFPEKYGN